MLNFSCPCPIAGNDMEHHPMVPIPNNDMSFAQHHQHPNSQIYSHSSPSHNTTRNYNPQPAVSRTTGPPPSQVSPDVSGTGTNQQQQDTRVGEKSSPTSSNNENDIAPSSCSSSDTPKSMPDLSRSSNGTLVSTPEKETTDPKNDANNAISPTPVQTSMQHEPHQVVNGAESSSDDVSIPGDEQSSPPSNATKNAPAAVEDRKMKEYQVDATHLKKQNLNVATVKLDAVPITMKQVNGELSPDCSNNKLSSEFRDNLSADHNNSASDVITIEQNVQGSVKKSFSAGEVKSYSNSVSVTKNYISQNNTPTSTSVTPTSKDCLKTNEVSTVEISKSPTPSNNLAQQCENNKPNNRSWASIASVKTRDIPYDGAAGRHTIGNHAQTNHVASENTGACDSKLAGSNTVPTNFDKRGGEGQGHFEFIFDDRYPDENDPVAFRLGEHFCRSPALDHQSIPLAPRGLYNQSNSCYINAILQVKSNNMKLSYSIFESIEEDIISFHLNCAGFTGLSAIRQRF